MSVKLLTEHHLEFLSLKGGCTRSFESTLVKMPHCWKSHVVAQFIIHKQVIVKVYTWLGKQLLPFCGRFTFERIHNAKEQIFFTKERRIIRQKSGCLNDSNERIFQVNVLMQGRIKYSWKGGSCL